MPLRGYGRWAAFGALLALSAPVCIQPAEATWATTGWTQHIIMGPSAHSIQFGANASFQNYGGRSVARYGRIGGPLQCVPFARDHSEVKLVGNAATWWGKAVGVYERGARPEVGSVLNFRPTGRMRLGHVAVVSRVIDSRNVEIDHANWAYPGGVSRAIDVVDVSPQNDWTAVRVALGQSSEFGSVYPTYGFIYSRPDNGTLVANNEFRPVPTLNPPLGEARPAAQRVLVGLGREADEEVAEAADDAQPRTRHTAYSRAKIAKPFHGAAMRRMAAHPQASTQASPGNNGAPGS